MRREVITCDVCEREIPLRGMETQHSYEVRHRFWINRMLRRETIRHVCGSCWHLMKTAVTEVKSVD